MDYTVHLFNAFHLDLGLGKHNLSTGTLKWMLVTTVPDPEADAVKADLTEITSGNGYTAGGITWTGKTWTRSSAISKLAGDDVLFTASGGNFNSAAVAAVLYNDSATNDELIAYLLFPFGVVVQSGSTFPLYLNPSTGIYLRD